MTFAGAGLLVLVAAALQSAQAPVSDDAAAGRLLFEGRGKCLTCHTVNDKGSRRARDLSWIGVLRTPDALRRSLADPSRHPDAGAFSAAEMDQLVAHLQTLRTMWRIEPGERTRDAAPASENAPFFNRPERDAEERPEQVIAALDIPKGATVADMGSGTGYYTWRLAEAVGPAGKVFAVDVQQRMLDLTRAAVEQRQLGNVEYVLAADTNPGLPENAFDLVFIAYAYHEFTNPERVMDAVRKSLKPGGRVAILEYAKESNIAPAAPLHKMSFEEIRREIEPIGFVIDRLFDFLPVQHGVIFKRK